ncbi:TonB family protein [Lysobacter sp. SG-8]|uniref:TonB family protein n=1 Tax=Marilutibacter penaei TaxID=2759900 RepID=A0A7W3U3K9_9GAMM|nr:TonB family protein [Lysobacter penaei]MBB1088284.1 TonB family protein [Lysobacter penaei]
MTNVELLQLLFESFVASSLAILAVLAVRAPLRRAFGAGNAYAAWLIVPAATLAVVMPVPSGTSSIGSSLPVIATSAWMDAAPAIERSGLALPWLLAWLSGAAATGLVLAVRHLRFVRALGRLQARADGTFVAETNGGLPAVLGLLRPRIVLPADFERRYTEVQQVLLVAHERQHLRHGDLQAHAAWCLGRCLLWFNPLIHVATGRFRHDQEMACDARVLGALRRHRRAYGEAMLETQLAHQGSPFGCHWGFSHPLKERIEMLKQSRMSRSRRFMGGLVSTLLVVSTGAAAWTLQPAASTAASQADMPSRVDDESRRLSPPRYPAEALASKLSGKVSLIITVDETGAPVDIQVEQATPAGVFDAASVEAAWQWRFTPAMEGGKPVRGQVRVPVYFEADGDPGLQKDAAAPMQRQVPVAWRGYNSLRESLTASWQPPQASTAPDC